jgi:deazaflavin-dependent oxidoreductase (nitroreductase family)
MPCKQRQQWPKALAAFLLGMFVGSSVSLRLVMSMLWRKKDQIFVRRVARFNKLWTNRATMAIAGRRYSPYAILRHTGRRSGRQYATPVITASLVDGFIIPLAYGEDSDWYLNLIAAGEGTLEWQGQCYTIEAPELVDDEIARAAFPRFVCSQLVRFGITRFVMVKIKHSAETLLEGEALQNALQPQ